MKNLLIGPVLVSLVLVSLVGCSGDSDPGTSTNDKPVACTAAQQAMTQCVAGVLQECDGSIWADSQSCADAGEQCLDAGDGAAFCQAAANACLSDESGQSRCGANSLEICNGAFWVPSSDCTTLDKSCHELSEDLALCVAPDDLCEGDATHSRCDGNILEICNGALWGSASDCSTATQVCHELDESSALCVDQAVICAAEDDGQSRCAGDYLEVCSGSLWVQSSDCAELNQSCAEASETLALCVSAADPCEASEAGLSRCDADILEICDGSNWLQSADCNTLGRSCHEMNPGLAFCVDEASLCDPTDVGVSLCDAANDSEVLQACNGSVWVATDCALSGEICHEIIAGEGFCIAANMFCSPAEVDYTRCADDRVQRCNGELWVNSTNCLDTDKVCIDNDAGVAYCRAPLPVAEEYEVCGSGVADCADGLVCDQNDLFGGSFCVVDCTTDNDVCAATQYCEVELHSYGLTERDFCWELGERHDTCLSEDGCTGSMGCIAVSGVSPECVVPCDSTAIGTIGSCSGAETCLAGPYVELEIVDQSEVVCSGLSDTTTCGDTYECLQTDSAVYNCARIMGFCGIEGEILDAFNETTMFNAVNDGLAQDDTHRDTLCELPGTAVFCGDMGGGSAEVECASTPWALTYNDATGYNFLCSEDADCLFVGGECLNFSAGPACGTIATICVPFCETAMGEAIVDACPATYSCVFPVDDVGYPVVEVSADQPVSCMTLGSAAGCSSGFICTQFPAGNYCARQRKVCEVN